MKVYACPDGIAAPQPDYANYNIERVQAQEAEHTQKLKEWLTKAGYTGKRTGEIVRFQVADGYAQYMLAEGRKSFLIHLPYGDAYDYRDVEFLPKAEIIKRIEQDKRLAAIFAQKGAA